MKFLIKDSVKDKIISQSANIFEALKMAEKEFENGIKRNAKHICVGVFIDEPKEGLGRFIKEYCKDYYGITTSSNPDYVHHQTGRVITEQFQGK